MRGSECRTTRLTDAADLDLTATRSWIRVDLVTIDLTELLEEDEILDEIECELEECEEVLELDADDLIPDDLDPPTQDIDDLLVEVPVAAAPQREPVREAKKSADASQKRPVLRRSWIAMPPSNNNARPIEEPTRPQVRAPALSLPKFPLLPTLPRPVASAPLPSFPLLPPEPRRSIVKPPPLRLPRFSV